MDDKRKSLTFVEIKVGLGLIGKELIRIECLPDSVQTVKLMKHGNAVNIIAWIVVYFCAFRESCGYFLW